ncbi:hypothetical protein F383_07646 [Gossypium arboreum]|uniref:Uncharacterized protein n=1 Tax=Gossypium arboreum TaxID=29729 RepID=A0A0B0PV99_GOSAR|nr:hypothetical protein F383_07646 [Gossypium arboreum]
MQRWGTNYANNPLKGRMSKSNIWINAQTTFHPPNIKTFFLRKPKAFSFTLKNPRVSDSAEAILRDLVASQHQENKGKRPKPRLQSMNQSSR